MVIIFGVDKKMAFIIDTYNRMDQWDQEHSEYVFEINGNWYAIKSVRLEWGFPVLPMRLEEEKKVEWFRVYESMDEALQFVFQLKTLN